MSSWKLQLSLQKLSIFFQKVLFINLQKVDWTQILDRQVRAWSHNPFVQEDRPCLLDRLHRIFHFGCNNRQHILVCLLAGTRKQLHDGKWLLQATYCNTPMIKPCRKERTKRLLFRYLNVKMWKGVVSFRSVSPLFISHRFGPRRIKSSCHLALFWSLRQLELHDHTMQEVSIAVFSR